MRRLLESRWMAYAVAAAAVFVAVGLRALLAPELGERVPYITLFGAVIVAAWFGGAGPAIAAAAFGYAAAEYFFVPGPFGSARLAELAAYMVSTALIAALGGKMHAARRQAEKVSAEVESSEERFRTFMDNSPASVFLKDEAGRYVFVNRAGERLLDATREQWLGKTDAELIAPETARIVEARDREVLESDASAVYALTMATREGERELHSTKFSLRDSHGRRYVGSVTVDLTDLKRSQEELRREREQLRIVADTMSVAVARVARDTTFVWVNRVFAEWLGQSAEHLVGRPIADVLGAEAAAQIRPYLDLVQRGERVRYERLADYVGLGRRWIHALYSPVFDSEGKPDGWVAVVSDIEERKQAEQALRAAQEQLHVVVNAIPAAVLRCSRELRYLWVNSVYAHWLGRPAHEIVGRRIDELLGADAMRELQPYIDRVLGGEQVHFERLVELPSGGSKRWVSIVYAPVLEPGGEASGWVGISFDIHERKQMEEALRDADRRKDEFLATLAHELRNPLAPIRNAMAILERKGPAEAELQWSREVINRQVDQMSRLVDDLLDIARISRGSLLVRKERVALERVVDVALETSRPPINAARHRLSVLMPNERVMLEADPTRLAQAFSNLLINAAKFTEPGGSISISATVEGGEVTVSVEDSGIGFGAEVASRLFQPFSQLPATRERSH